MLFLSGLVGIACKTPEFPGDLIVTALGKDSFSNCKSARQLLVVRVGRQCCSQLIHLATSGRWLADPCAPEYHDRMPNPVLFKQQLGFEVVHLQADTPHAVPRQELEVVVGTAITAAFQNRFDTGGGFAIFFDGLRSLPG